MRRRPSSLAFALSLLLALPAVAAGAQTVEFLCAVSSDEGTGEISEALLSGCEDAFFDLGIIAVDSRPLVLDRDGWLDPALGIAPARAGLVEYLVSIYIEYGSAQAGGRLLPVSLQYRVVRVEDASVLGEGSVEVPPASLDSPKKLEAYSRALGADLAKSCLPIITPSQMGERS